ncbi:DHH phosphoesterase [Decorospora gaudefroyi]|uniref:DHH phosphoesterase n=1 Tax=Decorospora gaudefroyi TaxID=184978 RepID=A0A6A5KKS9_9PLEO|nr:DHH phosphoesterase [Decorospora gaudefroyi]
MKAFYNLIPAFLAAGRVTAMPQNGVPQQAVLAASTKHTANPLGVGHFSEWSRATKKQFLVDWQNGKASEWTIVEGNEGGDLDSMTAALTWAYHLEHSSENTSHPIKAIALLQTPSHALDLRPENKVALDNSQMTPGHEDLLTMDELPEDPETLSRKLKGIVLVDHGSPLRKWSHAKIVSIFDHHKDRGTAPDAEPRVFETVASCTTLVARQMLDELEKLDQEYHMPHELLELVLSAIAIDSGGLSGKKTTQADIDVSKRILARSNWKKDDLEDVMEELDDELSKAQKDIDSLGLRDLLRRDWKGDFIDTPSPRTPTVSLGFASIPYSMDEQILKTDFAELFDWFAKHYRDGEKEKIREVVLTVRDDVRIDQDQADSLFNVVKEALENNDQGIDFQPWHRADELAPRQMVWTHKSHAGRKVIRPIVEAAVMGWE